MQTLQESIKSWLLQLSSTEYVGSLPTSPVTLTQLLDLSKHSIFPTTHLPYVNHIEVKTQTSSCLCGFHALHNMIWFIRALFEKTITVKLSALSKLNNNFTFWKFYSKARSHLISYLRANGEEYNIDSYLDDGPLDRGHLNYLLANYPKLLNAVTSYPEQRIEYCSVFFGYGILCNRSPVDHFTFGSTEELMAAEAKLKSFAVSKQDGALCIFLGVIKHWTLLVIHKEKDSKTFYFLDSNNTPFMHVPEKETYQVALEEMTDYYAQKGKPVKLKKVKVLKNMYIDTKKIIEIIYGVMQNSISMRTYSIDSDLRLFLREYQQAIFRIQSVIYKSRCVDFAGDSSVDSSEKLLDELNESLDKETEEKRIIAVRELYEWLLGYKPKVIHDCILHVIQVLGVEYVSPKSKAILNKWCEVQRKLLEYKSQFIEQQYTKSKSIDDAPETVLRNYQTLIEQFSQLLKQ